MGLLYVTSLKEGSGKTAISCGILSRYSLKGRSIAYARLGNDSGDVESVRAVLKLGEGAAVASSDPGELLSGPAAASDVLVVEGPPDGAAAVAARGGRVLFIGFYPEDRPADVIEKAEALGKGLAGVVVNAVPRNRLLENPWEKELKGRGLPVLGVLPEDRFLAAPSIEDVREALEGRLVCGEDRSGEILEYFMVGVYSLDPGPYYFSRRGRKGVIIRGDRPDMQLGALETEVRCLILTGEAEPHPYIRQMAELKGIPIMLVPLDVPTALSRLEELTASLRFRQERKLERVRDGGLDWEALDGALGLR